MELTINIKDKKNIVTFLNLIKKFDYVEIIDVKEDNLDLPAEHRKLLEERLIKIIAGKTTFRNWELIKGKYEGKTI